MLLITDQVNHLWIYRIEDTMIKQFSFETSSIGSNRIGKNIRHDQMVAMNVPIVNQLSMFQ